MNKQYKTVLKNHYKVLNLPVGGESANRVNFMQHMLVLYSPCYFSSPEGDIRKESKYYFLETSLN